MEEIRDSGSSTLIEVLRRRASAQPDHDAYIFLADGETETARLTWAEVDRRARAIGAELRDRGGAGQRALITYPAEAGPEFLTAFLGCLYAGAVAVPCDAAQGRGGAERLSWIAGDAKPRFVLGSPETNRLVTNAVAAYPLDVAAVPDTAADTWRDPGSGPATLALLQYTSGSTGNPRGVMVSHGNVMANEAAIKATCEHDGGSRFVGWLPLYHDMGLIANLLQPLYLGSQSVLMPPSAFLAKPMRWLAAVSRYRGVTSGGPNFAYDLCVAKARPRDLDGLDLSSWRVAFNGAEVVRAATLLRFLQAFGPAGFAPETFFPCYGLAESTLIVSGAPRGVPPRTVAADRGALRAGRCVPPAEDGAPARTLVSSGRPVAGTRVAIVDPDTRDELPDGQLGEVWVSGPGVAAGYWGRAAESAATFGNRLGAEPATFLRTGDVGTMLTGELYVVARLKDLIIIRGQNHYPEDVEHTAERAHPALRPSGGAAFAIDDGDNDDQEHLVVLYEVDTRAGEPDVADIAAAVRRAVSERHKIEVYAVVLVPKGSVPKTTSGKVRRLACRDRYLAGAMPLVGISVLDEGDLTVPEPALPDLAALPAEHRQAALADALLGAVAARAGVPAGTLDTAVPLRSAGLDSLGAIELEHRIQDRYHVDLPALTLLSDRSLTEVAADVLHRMGTADPGSRSPDPGPAGEGPLTPSQRALWFECQLAPPGPAYSLVRGLRLSGALDHAALDLAVGLVVARHAALRTRIVERDGVPAQVVDQAGPAVRREDLGTADDASVATRLAAEAARPFDLRAAEPLVRLTLLRRSETDHVLIIAAHHIVADFWSFVVVIRELAELYREAAGGAPAQLPPVRTAVIPAVRHAHDEGLWTYWRQRLAGAPAALDLPTDRRRPPTRGFRGADRPMCLDAELTARLRRFSQEHGTTLFTTLMAAFQVLLGRHAGQRDVLVGTLASGRDRAELADVVGCFVNLVPVRTRIHASDSFRSLLHRVRGELLRDLAHAGYPFDELVARLRPDRAAGGPAVVRALLVLHQEYGPRADGLRAAGLGVDGPRFGGGLLMRSVAVPQPWTHMDVTLNLAEVGGVLRGRLEYDTALFDAATVDGLAARFEHLLRLVVEDPDGRLDLLALPTPAEQRAALAAGRGSVRPRPHTLSLHGMVLDAAERHPDATAVALPAGTTEHLSYRALRRRSSGLAAELWAAGVRPGDVVGVLLARSLELPVAQLAVLRCGAAYLPLDPDDPPARHSWLVRDAGVRVVISSGEGRFDGQVDVVLDARAERAGGPPVVDVHPDQAAYVMYTSGSTGRPKGVVVPHRGIVNRLAWMTDAFEPRPADRVVHKAPITFDVSVWELFWPLTQGACLVLAPPGAHRDPDRLRALVRREQVSTAHFVPSLFSEFLAEDLDAPVLRRVVCSGEELPARVRDRALLTLPRARLHNLYGPTETSVDVTAWECRPGDRGPVPIGVPIANIDVHVLDAELGPLPAGVRGELCVGGVGLALGYLGRPGRTAATFVPDPFASAPGARLYRTGDQARRRHDGVIDYLGRTDHQVKIAGVRIELGEVEEGVRAQPGVRDAAVVVHEDVAGPALVAYVVGADPATPDPAAIAAALRALLPAAMVPIVRPVPRLPATANGKLDRAALPAPAVPVRAVVAPAPGAEQRIAALWSDVLGGVEVGAGDEFFAIGGDSIRALRLVAGLRRAGFAVTVADLLGGATVRSLAAAGPTEPDLDIEPSPFALCPESLRGRLPAGVVDAYPVSMAQRAVLAHQLRGFGHEVYVTSVHVRSGFDEPALRAALASVLVRHAYLRSSFDLTSAREPYQLVHHRLEPLLTVHDLRVAPAGEQERILAEWLPGERARPLDVRSGPLLRCTVHMRSDEAFQLSLSSFALDGWCTATVFTEMLVDYTAFRRGEPSPLTDPRVGYASFVALEQLASRSAPAREFWAAELAGATPCRLPRRTGTASGELARREEATVDPGLVAELRRLARELSVPLKSVLLAAHLRVVRLLAARDTVVTGLEVNGRPEREDGDRVVGVFNNIVPLRVPVARGSWVDLVRAAAEAEHRVQPHRRYPLALLERTHEVSSMFDTLFVYTHFHLYDQARALDGVELVAWQAPDQTYVPLTAHFTVDAITGELRLLLDYDPAKVTDDLAVATAGYYLRALARLAADPDAPHAMADLLSPDELRAQQDAGVTAGRARPGATVHELIMRQAERTPDSIAVAAGEVQLSYRSLVSRSHRLAAALRELGAGHDTVVGLPYRRDPDFVVAVLGVLRSGAAYLPFDPDQPASRVASLLAGASFVIDPPGLVTPHTSGPAVVAAGSTEPVVHPLALAYVIATSGTTGTPNLVGVPHVAVVNYLDWCAENYGLSPGVRTPVHSSAAFDLTVTSLLGALCTGGTAQLLPPDELAGAIAAGATGPLKITPAHLEAVGHQAGPACVVVGGEQLRRNHLRTWHTEPVINEYGPTEATVGCVTHRARPDDREDPVPIGRAIPGMRAQVLHDGLPVPTGTVAELHLGGVGLARGYLGRPGLTAERFLPAPVGFGERLYRTGDLAWLGTDGLLRYAGRVDRQLKIRGHRVEPGEIEHELCRHPAVRQAAVSAVSVGGSPRLVGYWVPRHEFDIDDEGESRGLREWLARRLPSHLVPAELVRLPAMPLSAHGKVDHRRLTDPAAARRDALVRFAAGLSDDAAAELLAAARAEPR